MRRAGPNQIVTGLLSELLQLVRKFVDGSLELVRRGGPKVAGWGWRRKWVGWVQIPGEAAGISTC